MMDENRNEPVGKVDELDVDRFYHGYAVEPITPHCLEGTLLKGREGAIYFTFAAKGLNMKESVDNGRTWGEPWHFVDRMGSRIKGSHLTVFRMQSGKLGLVYNDYENFPRGIPGRDNWSGIMFRESEDEGKTWSDPNLVYPLNGLCCSGHVILLSDGRILAPGFRWISHDATGESEGFSSPSFSYSFTCFSDDEGKSWQVSHSQLFISHYRFTCSLEEPTVVELGDGRLLMHLRSQVGRPYRSYSRDRGLTWSRPEPLPMAASFTPSILKRMPTGEILMIWNQISRAEILKGFHRHRLSCAISRDEGQTWENFKNLESLNDQSVIPPPPGDRLEIIEQWEDNGLYFQPSNKERYPRAPGVLRICYPDVLFVGEEAIVVYDYGYGTLGNNTSSTKLRIIPVEWFRTRENE